MKEKKYNVNLDYLKAFTVSIMTFTHTVGAVGDSANNLHIYRALINLASFPMFFFVFGWTTYLSYFSIDVIPWKRIKTAVWKIYLAYFINSMAYLLIFGSKKLILEIIGAAIFLKILRLSEFLPPFILALLFMTIFAKPIKQICAHPNFFWSTSAVFIFSPVFIHSQNIANPYFGILIGVNPQSFSSFPLIQYFIFYLLGIFFAFHNIKATIDWLIPTSIGVLVVISYLYLENIPQRFPPSFAWILLSLLMVMFLFSVFEFIQKWKIPHFCLAAIQKMGKNTLNFLVGSNIILFLLEKLGFHFSITGCAMLTTGIILLLLVASPNPKQNKIIPNANSIE